MIELEQVTKSFGPSIGRGDPTDAVSGLSLHVPAGETWAVAGPNGAGKSTLFALILGFIHPTEGSVRVNGLDPRTFLRREGAGYLPERFHLPGEWSVRAALRALARLEGLRGARALDRADYLIDRLGLSDHEDRPIARLSRGLYQRVGLAQALLGERRLVLLDEPTEGLDPIWRVHFRELVSELRESGCTTLIASHDLAEIERVADQAILLKGGKLQESVQLRGARVGAIEYRIEITSSVPLIHDIFPDARLIDGAEGAGEGAMSFMVRVADEADLSARLAALLDAGAVLASVAPASMPLETRLQRAIGGAEG